MENAAIEVWIYGLVMILGGIAGFVRVGSKASLISGVGFGLMLLVTGIGVWRGSQPCLLAAVVIALLLVVLFAIRYVKKRRFMPAGMLAVLSIVAAVMFVRALKR
ncbi:MAG TPA: TMEM14 family protein [Verrucomicrobiae bacterium]|nr:TMEM14 family protein [Verrucomicrobiae bacterium]